MDGEFSLASPAGQSEPKSTAAKFAHAIEIFGLIIFSA